MSYPPRQPVPVQSLDYDVTQNSPARLLLRTFGVLSILYAGVRLFAAGINGYLMYARPFSYPKIGWSRMAVVVGVTLSIINASIQLVAGFSCLHRLAVSRSLLMMTVLLGLLIAVYSVLSGVLSIYLANPSAYDLLNTATLVAVYLERVLPGVIYSVLTLVLLQNDAVKTEMRSW